MRLEWPSGLACRHVPVFDCVRGVAITPKLLPPRHRPCAASGRVTTPRATSTASARTSRTSSTRTWRRPMYVSLLCGIPPLWRAPVGPQHRGCPAPCVPGPRSIASCNAPRSARLAASGATSRRLTLVTRAAPPPPKRLEEEEVTSGGHTQRRGNPLPRCLRRAGSMSAQRATGKCARRTCSTRAGMSER
jgi:hypothetical protein